MADWVDCRLLPDRAAAVPTRLAAVVRNGVGLPQDLARVGIQRYYAAAEGAAGIDGIEYGGKCEDLLLRRDSNVNDITEDHGGAGNLRSRMGIDVSDPVQGARLTVDGHDVRAVVVQEFGFLVADDDVLAMDGGTGARDCTGRSIVVGDLVRPDQLARVFVDGIQVARRIRQKDGIAGHGGSGRNVAAGGENPLLGERVDVGRVDPALRGLAARVGDVVAAHTPFGSLGTRAYTDRQYQQNAFDHDVDFLLEPLLISSLANSIDCQARRGLDHFGYQDSIWRAGTVPSCR